MCGLLLWIWWRNLCLQFAETEITWVKVDNLKKKKLKWMSIYEIIKKNQMVVTTDIWYKMTYQKL